MRCHKAQLYILRAQREPLSPHDSQALARHLVDCPSCRKEREVTERLASLLKSIPVPSPSCVIRSESIRKHIEQLPHQRVHHHSIRRASALSALPALCGLIVTALYIRPFYEKPSLPVHFLEADVTAPTKTSPTPLLAGTNKEVGKGQDFSPESLSLGKKGEQGTSVAAVQSPKAKPTDVSPGLPSPTRRLARVINHPHKKSETRVARTLVHPVGNFDKPLYKGGHGDPVEGTEARSRVFIVVGTIASSDQAATQHTVVRHFVMERIPSGPPPSRFASLTSPSTRGDHSQEAQAW